MVMPRLFLRPKTHRGFSISPYGVHKLAGEYMMKYYGRVHGILGVGLRLFNVYGSRQDPEALTPA